MSFKPPPTVLHPERCIQSVRGDYHSYQCQRPRGYGPDGNYCKQHAPADASGAKPWFSVGFGNRITEKLMVEVSGAYLAAPGSKHKVKKNGYEVWFSTREEAVAFVLRRLTHNVEAYKSRLAEAEEELHKFNEQEKQ